MCRNTNAGFRQSADKFPRTEAASLIPALESALAAACSTPHHGTGSVLTSAGAREAALVTNGRMNKR